jgi:hypothetical protein
LNLPCGLSSFTFLLLLPFWVSLGNRFFFSNSFILTIYISCMHVKMGLTGWGSWPCGVNALTDDRSWEIE